MCATGIGVANENQQSVPVGFEVVDAETQKPLPCRVYVEDKDGQWFFAEPTTSDGTAVRYEKPKRANGRSVEMHTTVSAHPFTVQLPAGNYTVTVERGKEYLPVTKRITVKNAPSTHKLEMRRWIDMAQRGWYSGDTHVHRSVEDLPNVMMAEDLNVSFPLAYWTYDSATAPGLDRKNSPTPPNAELLEVDATHVIYPLNTEYEIFRIDGKSHTLGAFFVLNHKSAFTEGVPPVQPVMERARREGALLELDKHNWPWSMMLVPTLNVDLYELSNNHVWRTEFGFREFAEIEAEYMRIERDEEGWTEWGWIDFGFQNYYALLNCGFRLRPTAGTASGVHPVPLGFGRVYVHTGDDFNYDRWLRGLNEGRSFVTTGPMLFAQLNGQQPGHVFSQEEADSQPYRLTGTTVSEKELSRIEILLNGEVVRTLQPGNAKTSAGAYESRFDETLTVRATSWIAVRCIEERPGGRVRFAHASPFHIEVPGTTLQPRREEAAFLLKRVDDQLARNTGVLSEAALEEYREARRVYAELLEKAR